MLTANINVLAVLVAAVVSMGIGAVWYGPLFGKLWMKLTGLKKMGASKNKEMWRSYVAHFIASVLMSFVLANMLDYLSIFRFIDGFVFGFMIWLGFIATFTLGIVLWENKSFKLYILNNGYYLLSLLLMGGILAAWQ